MKNSYEKQVSENKSLKDRVSHLQHSNRNLHHANKDLKESKHELDYANERLEKHNRHLSREQNRGAAGHGRRMQQREAEGQFVPRETPEVKQSE